MPNIPLIGWALTRILLFINTNQKYQPAIRNLSSAFLFTWAYLEITQGVNYFRRTAGAVVMVLVLIGILKS